MKSLPLFLKIWTNPRSALAILVTMAFIFLWPALPLGGITRWLTFFYLYRPQNIFYAIMTILGGIYAGLYIYNRYISPVCKVGKADAGVATGIGGMVLGACPACIPALGLLLPLSVTIALSRVSLMAILISIALFVFLIYKMGGLRRV